MQIIPAILSKTLEEIEINLSRIKNVAEVVQIDICDGEFGAEKTWLPNGKDTLPVGFSYEFDVMVKDWKIYVAQCLLLKATSIVVHFDSFSDDDIKFLIEMIGRYDVALGISVSNDKDLSEHILLVRRVQKLYKNVFIQVMGIRNIGKQGEPFDDTAPARIALLKHQFDGIRIQVDGGVKLETIKILTDAGAESLVAGSAVFGEDDAQAAYNNLVALVS